MLSGSDLMQGGAAVGIAGGVFASIKTVPERVGRFLRSRIYTTCTLYNDDSLQRWFLLWLAQQKASFESTGLRAQIAGYRDEDGDFVPRRRSGQNGPKEIEIVAGDGMQVVKVYGATFWVTQNTQVTERGEIFRTVTITTKKKHRQQLERILTEALALESAPDKTHTRIYSASQHAHWQLRGRRKKRKLDSVILAGNQMEQMINACVNFVESEDWYVNLGIPYRMGILLSGAPGNGKSSLALALAGAMEVPLYVLPLGDVMLNDSALMTLFSTIPMGSIVVIEDIDATFHQREKKGSNSVTFSGLLNALDGPAASEGRIVVFTTNHPEKLDAALVRPGRVDYHFQLTNATPEQARRLWRWFKRPSEGEDAFAALADGTLSMAALQGMLLDRKTVVVGETNRPEDADGSRTLESRGPTREDPRTGRKRQVVQ